MKKNMVIFVLCLCLTLPAFAGCNRKEENIGFTATVKAVYSSTLMVSTTDDVGFTDASVNIAEAEVDFELQEGQTVFLEIAPAVMETSPVSVTAVSVELVADSYLRGAVVYGGVNSEIEGVSMVIDPGSVTSKGLTVIITDENYPRYTFGEWFELKTLAGDTWEDTPVVISGDYGFNDIGLYPKEDGTITLDINWEWLYGELESGTYKIVKALYFDTGYKYFSAEFNIE